MTRWIRRPGSWSAWLGPLAIIAVTFIAFYPSLTNGFVAWDDDLNFLDNPNYRGLGLGELEWMWTTFHLGHYIPLTWMTLGLDFILWGMNPAGYHFTNLTLHAVNAVLLYYIALEVLPRTRGFAGRTNAHRVILAAIFAALLFARHPLRVESVAWVTERRDVLSLMFYLLSVKCYMRSVDRPAGTRWLWVSVTMFAFALLSKATTLTLPAVLLVANIYPLRRLGGGAGWWTPGARRVLLGLAPFAALSAGIAMLSIAALKPPEQLTLEGKIAVSFYGVAFYLWKTVWPMSLSPIYEMPTRVHPSDAVFAVSYVAVISVTAFALAVRRRLPDITACWIVFVITVFPMLGVVTNGPQIAADRYTYHAAPVLAFLAAALMGMAWNRFRHVSPALAAALTLCLAVLTWRQTHVWRDSESLWSHVIRLDSSSAIGHAGLAALYLQQDRTSSAIAHYERSLSANPSYEEGHNNLGVALARQGRFDDAYHHFAIALSLRPGYAQVHSNWGSALASQGRLEVAMHHYRLAVGIDPNFADAHTNWGNALVRARRPDEAIAHYREAVRARPDHADAHLNWGVALVQQGNLNGAIDRFRRAVALRPDDPSARDYLDRATQLRKP